MKWPLWHKHDWVLVEAQVHGFRHGQETFCLFRCSSCGKVDVDRLPGAWSADALCGRMAK